MPTRPFTVALDNTRAGIERDIPRGAWDQSDMERECELLRRAAHIYPMSSWAAESVVNDCGIDLDRITVMPPSIDITRFHPPTRRDKSPLRVIFIGNDILRKGGDRLARWIKGPLAGKAELHIVSGDPDTKRLVGEGVVIHGRVDNDQLVRDLLPRMDVLCLPTRSDMSPQVLAEAAAAGLPAVASNLAGVPDLVQHEQTGLLVDAEDDDGFITAIERLAQLPEYAIRLGTAARMRAEQKFSAEKNFNDLIERLIVIENQS
jgi:glycosyltransferase involved in cell wall biosynthesis